MKNSFQNKLKAFTLCAGFFSLVACKEKTTIASGLVPPVDNINTFEVTNLPLSVGNGYFDSLATNNPNFPYVGIGGITDDAFFGKTQAGAYIQFALPSTNFPFTADVIIDSTVFSMPYIGTSYGDTDRTVSSNALHLKVFEINDDFAYGDGSKVYFSFNKLNYNPTPLGEATVPLSKITDTVVLSTGDTVSNLLRINVPGLIPKFKNMTANDFASQDAFTTAFKGIYIGPDTTATQNILSYFGLSGYGSYTNYSHAQVEVYYHSASDTTRKHVNFYFTTGKVPFFNGIYRNYASVPAKNYINNPSVNSDSLIIQGYPGFRSDITIKLNNGAIPLSVINKATLVLTALKIGDDNRFNVPPQLYIKGVNPDSTEYVIADLLLNNGGPNSNGSGFVGGVAKKVTIGGMDYYQYEINIPRELQSALSMNKSEIKLRISPTASFPGAYRMIGAGPNGTNADVRLKFDVIYTKLNH